MSLNLSLFSDLPMVVLMAMCAIALAAGVVKGAIGFAMPLIMVSGLSSIMDPKLALAALILPVVLSNVMQTFRTGIAEARSAAWEFRRYIIVIVVTILLAAQLVNAIPNKAFYAVLGVPVVILCLIQLAGWRPVISDKARVPTEYGLGLLSGLLGGIAGTWGPTTVLYLLAINTPKTRQIVVQGVIYGVGAVALLAGHLKSGIFNETTAPLSALLLVPALLGMWIGFKIQDRMNPTVFRKATLVVLTLAGLNLIRKAYLA